MIRAIIRFITLSLIAFLGSTFSCNAEMKVIIDPDMGNDDWIAIAYLLKAKDIDIKAITASGNGLSSCPAAAMNARYLLKLAGKDSIPVSCGSDWPLDGYNSYPILWRSKANSMMDLRPVQPENAESEIDSVQLIVDTLLNSESPITILSIGAMTNIASALKADPKVKNKIDRVVAMAGAINVPGNLQVHGFTEQIPNKLAEWNVWIDPVAAKYVFNSGVPITLVPLDTTNRLHL